MADDPERDLIPIRDVPSGSQYAAHTECSDTCGLDRPSLLEKKIAEQLSRNVLEDQLYQLRDENIELKKNSRKQEENIKKLTTKMSRLITEQKKLQASSSPSHKRDLEMEEAMEDLHDKIRILEKNNVHLREKLLVAKQQVISHNRPTNAYQHVPPKVNTNRQRSGILSYIGQPNLRSGTTPRGNLPLPPYAIQLLDEARVEIFNLKEAVMTQKNDLDIYEQEVELYKERLRMKDSEFDDEMNLLRTQITEGQRQHVQENLDLIRLHRELKQKNSKITTLQAQLVEMEEKIRAQRAQQDRLMQEIDDKTQQTRDEQKKSLDLFSELQKNKAALHNYAELQDSFKSIRKENDVLKDTNDKLIKSVINQERERSSHSSEQGLKDRIAVLESSLIEEKNEKSLLLQGMGEEKDKYLTLCREHEDLQKMYSKIKITCEELETMTNILKDQEVDFNELGEAIALVKLKKQRSIKLDFLEGLPHLDEDEDLKSKLNVAEREHAEIAKELCMVREMLTTQYKLNQVAQDEIKKLTEKYSQSEQEYQTKLREYANLLDIRSAKIQKLERQLNDVAYGTKKIKLEEFQINCTALETLDLDEGENIFEIRIVKFVYSEDGLKFLQNSNPMTFLSWNFFEYELQSTPVMKGTTVPFNFAAHYKVKMDDFFLFYLHKNTIIVELHQSLSTDYRTLAACQLKFSELLEQPHGRLHGTQSLIGIHEEAGGIIFGTLHFWVKMHLPMEEAFKLYKQKYKALKYIQSNQVCSSTAVKFLDETARKDSSLNDLHIKILRCRRLRGLSETVQPSSFCVYKFYNFSDRDTIIVPSSNDPEYSDHQTFSVCRDDNFENYLRTENLYIYVFDDTNPDMTSYIGRASVPLVPLSHEKPVTGIFELSKEDVKVSCGQIELAVYWQQAPSMPTPLPSFVDQKIEFPPHVVPVFPNLVGSEEFLKEVDVEFLSEISSNLLKGNQKDGFQTSTPIRVSPNSSSSSSAHFVVETAVQGGDKKDDTPAPGIKEVLSDTISPHHESDTDSGSTSPDFANHTEKKFSSMHPQPNADLLKELKAKLAIQVPDDDTMSEKRQEISFEELSDEDDKQVLSEIHSSSQSEPEAKQDSSPSAALDASQTSSAPSIVIGIHQLSLKPNSSVLDDPKIQMLYVEYKFLNYPLEELETPYSLPKPTPPESITFEYKKVFPFHPEENLDKFRLLAQMFNPDTPEARWIKFTVVSEPPSDDEGLECDDVGYAYVDLKEIISHNKDMVQEKIPIFDAKQPETEIGQLTVTIEALKVLHFL